MPEQTPNPQSFPPGLIGVPAVAWMWTETIPGFIRLKESMPPGSAMRFVTECTTICSKRNMLVNMLLEEGLQWLLFVDSDMTVPADVLQRLLANEADIVGGMCCNRREPYCVCAGRVVERGHSTDPLRPVDDLGFRTNSLAHTMVNHGAIPVDVLGTGVMLIHRHVFEAMDRPWFVANEQCFNGLNEDFNFCIRARDLGFTIVCDTSVPCGHMTEMIITPALALKLNNPDSQLAAAVGAPLNGKTAAVDLRGLGGPRESGKRRVVTPAVATLARRSDITAAVDARGFRHHVVWQPVTPWPAVACPK